MADFSKSVEELPSLYLRFGGRGILSRWELSIRKNPLWHVYHNLTTGGRLLFPDGVVDMQPDKVYLIPIYTHFGITMTEPLMEHCYVDFEVIGTECEKIEKKLFEFDAEPYKHQLEACFGSGFSSLAACSLIFSLLQKIVPNTYVDQQIRIGDPRIKKAVEYIKRSAAANRYENLNNQQLSKYAGTSQGNFRHLFLKEMKISPQKYILGLKLEAARKLLLSSSISIEEIAFMTGMGDRYQLTKHFKAAYNEPPARFRKIHKEANTASFSIN